MALTNLSNVQLAELQARLEAVWAEPQKSKNYVPRVDALKTVLEQQTAMLTPIEDPEREYDFKVKWVDHTAGVPADITQNDDCTNVKGTEGAGKTKTYALDFKKSLTFSVELDQLEKSFIPYEEMVATGQAAVIKALLETFNNTIPAAIEANRGDVTAGLVAGATGWTADVPGKRITIASANFIADDIIPQLMKVSRLLRNQSGIILDGGQLFNQYYKGLKTYVNDNGKTVNEMFRDLPYRHDLDSFAAASLSDVTYLIDPGTIAIANRSKYPSIANAKWTNGASGSYLRYSTPVNIADMPKLAFVTQGGLKKQSLALDTQYAIVCDNGKEYATWKFILRAGVFFNPVRLLTGNTGITKLVKV